MVSWSTNTAFSLTLNFWSTLKAQIQLFLKSNICIMKPKLLLNTAIRRKYSSPQHTQKATFLLENYFFKFLVELWIIHSAKVIILRTTLNKIKFCFILVLRIFRFTLFKIVLNFYYNLTFQSLLLLNYHNRFQRLPFYNNKKLMIRFVGNEN